MNTIKNPKVSTASTTSPNPSLVGVNPVFTVYDNHQKLKIIERNEIFYAEYSTKEWAIKQIKEKSFF